MTAVPDRAALTVRRESFPLRGTFRISRGAKTTAEVVVAEITRGGIVARGECLPYARYGETVESVEGAIAEMADAVAAGLDRRSLQTVMPPGAARNALDCAFWDLEAKAAGVPVWRLAGFAAPPEPVVTVYTLSLDTVDAMAQAARAATERFAGVPLTLKLKLTGEGDLDRVSAVRASAPDATLVVDANEGWSLDHLERFADAFAALKVRMIEQPLPAGADEVLRDLDLPVPLGADESCHDLSSLDRLKGLYDYVNIKLDKTGGLTEALKLKQAAEQAGFGVMVGCMVATSLAMAPAVLVAQGAPLVDLDGPLWLARDREPPLRYDGVTVHPPEPALWG